MAGVIAARPPGPTLGAGASSHPRAPTSAPQPLPMPVGTLSSSRRIGPSGSIRLALPTIPGTPPDGLLRRRPAVARAGAVSFSATVTRSRRTSTEDSPTPPGLLWFSAMGVECVEWPKDPPALLTEETLFGSLTLDSLKEELAVREIPRKGRKSVLVQRLLQAIEAELEEVLRQQLAEQYGSEAADDHQLICELKTSIRDETLAAVLGTAAGGPEEENEGKYLEDWSFCDEDDPPYEEVEKGEGKYDYEDYGDLETTDEDLASEPEEKGKEEEDYEEYGDESIDEGGRPEESYDYEEYGEESIDEGADRATARTVSAFQRLEMRQTGRTRPVPPLTELRTENNMSSAAGRGASAAAGGHSAKGELPFGSKPAAEEVLFGGSPSAQFPGRLDDESDWLDLDNLDSQPVGVAEAEDPSLSSIYDSLPLPPPAPPLDLQSGGHTRQRDTDRGGNMMEVTVLANPDETGEGFVTTTLILELPASSWLFNAGEDLQRHLLDTEIRNGRLCRIFISSAQASNILGLPGLLCTISSSREHADKSKAQSAVHLYGPAGLAEFLACALQVSETYMPMPIIVHELVTGPVEKEAQTARQLVRRAKLYVKQIPPDQLNPKGYTSCHLGQTRVNVREAQYVRPNGRLERLEMAANARNSTLGRGHPPTQDLQDMTWTFRCDDEVVVTAALLSHQLPAYYGFVVEEPTKAGRLDPEAALALGVQKGKAFAQLKSGESVIASDGSTVHAEQVVSPDRPGRKLAVLGECLGAGRAMFNMATQADLITHAAQCHLLNQEVKSMAAEAGRFTAEAEARGLVLTHCPVEYFESNFGQNDGTVSFSELRDTLEAEAAVAFGHQQAVVVAADMFSFNIPCRE